MYKAEKEKNNTLSEFNFFKNYFDRVTAHLEFKYSSEMPILEDLYLEMSKYDNLSKYNYM